MDYKIIRIGRGSNTPKKFKQCDWCGREMATYRFEFSDSNSKRTVICPDCVMDQFELYEKSKKGGGWIKRTVKSISNWLRMTVRFQLNTNVKPEPKS